MECAGDLDFSIAPRVGMLDSRHWHVHLAPEDDTPAKDGTRTSPVRV